MVGTRLSVPLLFRYIERIKAGHVKTMQSSSHQQHHSWHVSPMLFPCDAKYTLPHALFAGRWDAWHRVLSFCG
jgi:hypothetical protein